MGLATILGLLLAASPPPSQADMERVQDVRVAKIGYDLVTANARHCARRAPVTGLLLGVQDAGRYPSVVAILPGSPASGVDVAPDDIIQSIGGAAMPALGDPAFKDASVWMRAVLDRLDAGLAAGPAAVTIRRGERTLSVDLTGVPACATRFVISNTRALNAGADGDYVRISQSMFAEFRGDDELAAILAHELAHNILGHRAVLDAQGVSRGLFGRIGKNAAKIRETEIAADRLSLTLMRDAGYRMAAAPEFWARFEKKHGSGIFADATHLNGRRRVDMLNAEIARIDGR
jgi:hypothetical protein